MSISATLANALTGLTAAARSAQVVSTNVSNATTEGYARREIDLSARLRAGDGYGVQVDGVNRIVDENIVRERRLASAAVGSANEPAAFLRDVMDYIGEPSDASSLTAQTSILRVCPFGSNVASGKRFAAVRSLECGYVACEQTQ